MTMPSPPKQPNKSTATMLYNQQKTGEELSEYFASINERQLAQTGSTATGSTATDAERGNVVAGSLRVVTAPEVMVQTFGEARVCAGVAADTGACGVRGHIQPLYEVQQKHRGEPMGVLKVRGDSMEPVVPDGATVYFNPNRAVQSRDLLVIYYKGESLLKYVIEDQAHGCYWLKSENSRKYPIRRVEMS